MKRYRTLTLSLLPIVAILAGVTWWWATGRMSAYALSSAVKYRFNASTSNEPPKEIEKLEARASAHPTDAFGLNELASRYVLEAQVTGDVAWYEKAEAVATKSLSLLASPNPAKAILAQVYEARHQFDDAIHWAEESMKDRPSSAPLQVIVTSYLAQGKYLEANRFADQLVQRLPGAATYLTRGLVRAAQGREDEAIFDFHRASELEDFGDPHGAARLRALWGRLLTIRGEFPAAQALLKQSLSIVPNNHLALSLYGDLELARGNPLLAEKYLMEAFSNSKQLRYLIHAARAKQRSGNLGGAQEIWENAEHIARKDLGVGGYGHRLDLIQILVDRGGDADFKEAAQLGWQETKVRRNTETLFYYAKALAGLKHWTEARDVMGELLSSGGKDADLYELEGRIQQALGYFPHAAFYFQLAQKRNPYLKSAAQSLAVLYKMPRIVQGSFIQ